MTKIGPKERATPGVDQSQPRPSVNKKRIVGRRDDGGWIFTWGADAKEAVESTMIAKVIEAVDRSNLIELTRAVNTDSCSLS